MAVRRDSSLQPRYESSDYRPPPISKQVLAPQRWTGFQKKSNFILFLLTTGVFALFCIARIPSFNYSYWLGSNFTQRFFFSEGMMAVLMKIHLRSVIPAGIILPVQFIPSIRQRYPYLHGLTGRLLFLLLLIGNITAIGVSPHAFGGTVTTQSLVFILAASTTFTIYKSWTSIRALHVDQHRAWVLRTWSYASAILTLRIFLILFSILTVRMAPRSYKAAKSCDEILFLHNTLNLSISDAYSRYPQCVNSASGNSSVYVVVTPALDRSRPEEFSELLNMCFGVAGWAAVFVHALLVEVYLNATLDEGERLRKISVLRRKAAGLKEE